MQTTLHILVLTLFGCPPGRAADTADTGQVEVHHVDGVVQGRVEAPAGTYVFIPVDWDGDGAEDGRFEAWTDGGGRFRIEGVPGGDYAVLTGEDDPQELAVSAPM